MKSLIITLTLFGNTSLFAQPILNAVDLNPIIGEQFLVATCNWISEGSAGANVTWDLSSLIQIDSSIVSVNAANPNFPPSNVTLTTSPSLESYEYYSIDGAYQYGSYTGTETTYQDPSKSLSYPLSITTMETDTFYGTYFNGTPFIREGVISIEGDGYGTLITPEGTLTDVVRVKRIRTFSDSSQFMVINTQSTTYSWYKAGIHYPVAYVNTYDWNGSVSQSAGYLKISQLGLKELVNNKREIIKITDLMGKETEYKPNTVLLYIYSDGTTEKVFRFE